MNEDALEIVIPIAIAFALIIGYGTVLLLPVLLSKTKISIKLENDKDKYERGEIVRGIIKLNAKKQIKARGFFVSINGLRKYGYQTRRRYQEIFYSEEKTLDGEKTYSGEKEYKFEFLIPKNTSPTTYQGDIGIWFDMTERQVWQIEAKLDLQMASDVNEYKRIIVT